MTLNNADLKWLAIDFDGTLCHSEPPTFEPTYPIKGAVEHMQKLHAEGWKLTIFTARPWSDYQLVEDWLLANNVPFRRIICGKPLYYRLIDDRNIAFHSWEDAVDKLHQTLR